MNIFQPVEIEIKTGCTRDELIQRLGKRAKFDGDKFKIESEPLGFIPRSYVVGEIRMTEEWTIVFLKVYASLFLRIFSYIWLGGVGCAIITFSIKALINWKYDSEILWTIVFWIVGFVISQLTFRTSSEMQEESIRQLVRSGD